jgi:hypothetical protein
MDYECSQLSWQNGDVLDKKTNINRNFERQKLFSNMNTRQYTVRDKIKTTYGFDLSDLLLVELATRMNKIVQKFNSKPIFYPIYHIINYIYQFLY